MRVQTVYHPQFEDWLFHVLLPLAAYAVLALSAFAAWSCPREVLFGVGAAALLLLFVGIHNAWVSVAYHVFVNRPDPKTERRRDETSGEENRDTRYQGLKGEAKCRSANSETATWKCRPSGSAAWA
jgi:hypothetical protein